MTHEEGSTSTPAPGGSRRIRLRSLGAADLPDVLRVYHECPGFFLQVAGTARVPESYVREEMTGAPPGFDPAGKHFLGIHAGDDDELVGVVDFLVGYPQPGHGCLGLLLISERHRRRGLGAAAVAAVEAWAHARGVREATLGVELVNETALRFWRACGWIPTGELFEHEVLGRPQRAEVFRKTLRGG